MNDTVKSINNRIDLLFKANQKYFSKNGENNMRLMNMILCLNERKLEIINSWFRVL